MTNRIRIKIECSEEWINFNSYDRVEVCENGEDYTIRNSSGTYFHIPNLIKFLEEKPVGCYGNCGFSISDKSSIGFADKAPIPHKYMYECDYLGCINFVPIGSNVDIVNFISCNNMSLDAIKTLHNWLNIPPYIQHKNKSNWTLITAFFDLTVKDDVTFASRSLDHYFDNCISTLSYDCNMVIFCEKSTYDRIYSIRKKYCKEIAGNGLENTKFVIMEIEDFPLYQYKERITKNREKIPDPDPRNNPSYYLFCMARYAMLKKITKDNPFNSTHFAWINFCMSRMGLRNIELLSKCIALNRDKFSTVYIGYIQEREINSSFNFIQEGRCSMCSGFFTGNKENMFEVCDLIEKKFLYYLDLGYGHADEQLYSPVYFERPELFEVYFGDYNTMITNYVECIEHPHPAIQFLIPSSFDDSKHSLCNSACEKVYKGYLKGYYGLTDVQIVDIMRLWYASSWYLDDINTCNVILQNIRNLIKNEKFYSAICYRIRDIISFTDFHRLKDPSLKNKKLVVLNEESATKFLDLEKNIYIVYSENIPITENVLIDSNPIYRPFYLK